MHAIVQPYLAQLGLGISADTAVAGLSIAQQQLVEIAKALSLKARVLIMDEPTSSLTLAETSRLHEIVAGLRADGVGVVYISHRLGEVRAVADRAVVLRDGANAGSLAREELTHDNMVRLMVGRDIAAQAHSRGVAGRDDCFRIEGLRTRRYPQQTVSFGVSRGEILGVAGLVGAGRSEVAQALFGVERPLAGHVLLDGTAIEIADPAAAIRQGVFLVPEDRRTAGLVVDFSVRENVTLPRWTDTRRTGWCRSRRNGSAPLPSATSCTSRRRRSRSRRAFERRQSAEGRAGEVARSRPEGADRRRTDARHRRRCQSRNLYAAARPRRGGRGIVMISSDMEEILNMSDRVAVMHEGAITGTLARAECTEERIMTLAVG
jgi:ribose transport system ATP-binding protein